MLLKWYQVPVMTVRIRLRLKAKTPGKSNRQLAMTLSRWMPPLSALASVLAFWRLGADIDRNLGFGISQGLLSHWQVWLATGLLLHVAGPMLARYGRGDGAAIP